jgi:MGT family glycosyltransferase
MARILITGIPTYGLANPTFGLTTALVEAGHDVDYLMPQAFRAGVERCGATLLPYASYLKGKPVTQPVQGLAARVLFDELTREVLGRGNDYDLVIASGLQPQFNRIERGLDRPVVRFSPIFWQNDRTLAELMAQAKALPHLVRWGLATPWLRQAASQVGGRALLGNGGRDIVDLLSPQSSVLNLTVSSRYYQPRADDFDETCVYLGPTPTAAVPDPAFPMDRLRDHPGPIIYVTLGTVYNGWIGYFRKVAEAFANTDALVVIAAGDAANAARIGPVAPNVLVYPFVPQSEVLSLASLCIAHGGFGSITDAVLNQVPLVVTPLGGDQFFNAYRLLALDAATVMAPLEVSVQRIRHLANGILDGSARPGGLAQLAESFRTAPGPQLGVQRIEELLASSSGTAGVHS